MAKTERTWKPTVPLSKRWLQTGLTNFRYRGIAMEFELFADESQKETERLVTNIVKAMLKADSVVDWSKVDLEPI